MEHSSSHAKELNQFTEKNECRFYGEKYPEILHFFSRDLCEHLSMLAQKRGKEDVSTAQWFLSKVGLF